MWEEDSVGIRECTVALDYDVMLGGVVQDWRLLIIDVWME